MVSRISMIYKAFRANNTKTPPPKKRLKMVRNLGLPSNQKSEDGTSYSGCLFIQPTGDMRSKEEENADADRLPDHRRVRVSDEASN